MRKFPHIFDRERVFGAFIDGREQRASLQSRRLLILRLQILKSTLQVQQVQHRHLAKASEDGAFGVAAHQPGKLHVALRRLWPIMVVEMVMVTAVVWVAVVDTAGARHD